MIKQRRQLKDTRISNSVKISCFTKFSFDRPLATAAFKGLKLFSLTKCNKYDRSFKTLKLNYRNYDHKNIKYTYSKEKYIHLFESLSKSLIITKRNTLIYPIDSKRRNLLRAIMVTEECIRWKLHHVIKNNRRFFAEQYKNNTQKGRQ